MTVIGMSKSANALSRPFEVRPHAEQRTTATLALVYTIWILMWFEPDRLLFSFGLHFMVRIFALLLIPAVIIIALHARREVFYWPFLLITGIHVIWVPFALNSGLALDGLKMILHYFIA